MIKLLLELHVCLLSRTGGISLLPLFVKLWMKVERKLFDFFVKK
jgi:hypothetical protein